MPLDCFCRYIYSILGMKSVTKLIVANINSCDCIIFPPFQMKPPDVRTIYKFETVYFGLRLVSNTLSQNCHILGIKISKIITTNVITLDSGRSFIIRLERMESPVVEWSTDVKYPPRHICIYLINY